MKNKLILPMFLSTVVLITITLSSSIKAESTKGQREFARKYQGEYNSRENVINNVAFDVKMADHNSGQSGAKITDEQMANVAGAVFRMSVLKDLGSYYPGIGSDGKLHYGENGSKTMTVPDLEETRVSAIEKAFCGNEDGKKALHDQIRHELVTMRRVKEKSVPLESYKAAYKEICDDDKLPEILLAEEKRRQQQESDSKVHLVDRQQNNKTMQDIAKAFNDPDSSIMTKGNPAFVTKKPLREMFDLANDKDERLSPEETEEFSTAVLEYDLRTKQAVLQSKGEEMKVRKDRENNIDKVCSGDKDGLRDIVKRYSDMFDVDLAAGKPFESGLTAACNEATKLTGMDKRKRY